LSEKRLYNQFDFGNPEIICAIAFIVEHQDVIYIHAEKQVPLENIVNLMVHEYLHAIITDLENQETSGMLDRLGSSCWTGLMP
jgi:hypothetical protein